ncbi:MAG TPA: glycosyltransferase family 4 protein [Egibacteraceae bacterium]
MHVALIGPTHPYKGGVAIHTTVLAHRLAAHGHDTELVSWSAQYPERLYPGQQRVTEPETPPYPHTTYPLAWNRPDSWLRTGIRLARQRVDVVVVSLVTTVQIPAYLAILAGLRLTRGPRPRTVALCHNVLPHETRRGDRTLVRALLRAVDGLLVHSQAQADLARTLTARPVRIAELPFGLEVVPPPRDGRPHRRLLFFGIVRPYKGLEDLLRALSAVPDVQLVVAGEFWQGQAETEQLIAELGIGDRVELRPRYVPAEELEELFAQVDAVVLPYRHATGTQNVGMAFAHGLPVVATDAGTLGEQIRDGVDGLVVPAGDVDALAAALRRLYEQDGLLATLTAQVRPPPIDEQWRSYTTELLAAAGRPG